MKRLVVLVFGFCSLICFSQEIISTTEGGDWNNSKTWSNGKIPDSNSNVVIKGKVLVKESVQCNNLEISKGGNLELAQSADSLTAKVNENLKIDDGTLVIKDKWKLYTSLLNKTDKSSIYNFGIISVGK
jgi:hypothetical protein